jgi:hypothetical protein
MRLNYALQMPKSGIRDVASYSALYLTDFPPFN